MFVRIICAKEKQTLLARCAWDRDGVPASPFKVFAAQLLRKLSAQSEVGSAAESPFPKVVFFPE